MPETWLHIVLTAILLLAALPVLALLLSRWPWLGLSAFWIVAVVKMAVLIYLYVFRVLDITVIAAAVILLAVLAVAFTRGFRNARVDGWLVLFHLAYGALMIVSLAWTTAPNYGLSKVLRYNVFSTIALVAPMLVLQRGTRDMDRMARALFVVGLITTGVILVSPTYQYGKEWHLRQTAFEGSPLNAAFIIAAGVILAVTYMRGWGRIFKILVLGGVPLMLGAIYRTGSRAMFVQPFIGVGFWILVLRSRFRWLHRAWVIGLLGVAVLAVVFFAAGSPTHRVKKALEDPWGTIISSPRVVQWRLVTDRVAERPLLGHGCGSFAMVLFGDDRRGFPHNPLLEAYYEQGLPGALIIMAFMMLPFYRYAKWKMASRRLGVASADEDAWFAVALASVLAMQVRGDMADIRLVWFVLGILSSLSLGLPLGAQQAPGVVHQGLSDWPEGVGPRMARTPEVLRG